MAAADDDRAIVARARDYPFPYPREDFVYADNALLPFDAKLTEGRTPVLAIGSNQSPIRLGQKFGHDARHRIAVQRAALHDFDVVYSAHVAIYGSVPAMLQVSPGSVVSIAITWLDDEQLEIMNATELRSGNYHLAELESLSLRLDDGRSIDRLHAYVGRRGHLSGPAGSAMALRAVTCENRCYPDMHTHDTLELVRGQHAPDLDGHEFILRLVRDQSFRQHIIEQMQTGATPFGHPARVVA